MRGFWSYIFCCCNSDEERDVLMQPKQQHGLDDIYTKFQSLQEEVATIKQTLPTSEQNGGVCVVNSQQNRVNVIINQFVDKHFVSSNGDAPITKQEILQLAQTISHSLTLLTQELKHEFQQELNCKLGIMQQLNQEQSTATNHMFFEYILHTNLQQCYVAATTRALLSKLTSPEKIKVLELSEKILGELNTQATRDHQERSEALGEYLLDTFLSPSQPITANPNLQLAGDMLTHNTEDQ